MEICEKSLNEITEEFFPQSYCGNVCGKAQSYYHDKKVIEYILSQTIQGLITISCYAKR